MSEHTAGPWTLDMDIDTCNGASIGIRPLRRSLILADVYSVTPAAARHAVSITHDEEALANARLIAAAPDMAAERDELIRVLETIRDSYNPLVSGRETAALMHEWASNALAKVDKIAPCTEVETGRPAGLVRGSR